jgi:hypothetical protein
LSAVARRTAALMLSAVVLSGIVVACGGSSTLSTAQYRSKLTAACTTATAATAKLPSEQLAKHLSIDQLRRRADEIGHAFGSTVASLHPPASLRADQRRLLALARRPQPADPTRVQAIVASERMRAVYAKIGASGCVKPLDRSLARLRAS